MIIEHLENGVYTSKDGERTLLTVTDLGENRYRAVNLNFDITAEVVPLDEYRTRSRVIEHKRRGRDGRYRRTAKLAEHDSRWLVYMLEKIGMIRTTKTIDGGMDA
jgi:hypothetical protein